MSALTPPKAFAKFFAFKSRPYNLSVDKSALEFLSRAQSWAANELFQIARLRQTITPTKKEQVIDFAMPAADVKICLPMSAQHNA
jgi:hypothetical protein